MITEQNVNEAFDTLEKAFAELAAIEDTQADKQAKLIEELKEYKEGSKAAEAVQKRLRILQSKSSEAQRAYRLAAMRADRVRLLLDVQKTAMGRD